MAALDLERRANRRHDRRRPYPERFAELWNALEARAKQLPQDDATWKSHSVPRAYRRLLKLAWKGSNRLGFESPTLRRQITARGLLAR